MNYELAVDGQIKFAVHELTGRNVEMLVNQRKDPGGYKVSPDASP